MHDYTMGDYAVTELKVTRILPYLVPAIQHIFTTHGGALEVQNDHCLARFPPGTKKTEIWPRTRTARCWITFPDGYLIYEVYLTTSGLSYLQFPAVDIPADIREKYLALSVHCARQE